MTLHSTSSRLGAENSAATTRGRRKPKAVRIDYGDATGPESHRTRPAYLIGECGHTLLWLARTPADRNAPAYLANRLGRRMTCQHPDCRIP